MRLRNSKSVIYVGFAMLGAVIIALTAIGFAHSISVGAELKNLTDTHHEASRLAYEMRLSVRERLISLTLIANLVDPFARDAEIMRFNSIGARFAEARPRLMNFKLTDEEQQLLTRQAEITHDLRPLHDEFIDAAIRGDGELTRDLLTKRIIPVQNDVIDTIKDLQDLQEVLNHQVVDRYTRKQELSNVLFMSLLGLSTIIAGAIIGYIVSRRISRTEQALFKEKERYALAVRGANDGIWDWDLETNQVYFSPRWKDILGYEEHKIANKIDEWFKRIHVDDAESTLAKLNQHLNGHSYYFDTVHRMQHQDGSYHWVHNRALALRDESGKGYRIAGSMEDITERRLAEDKLKNSEKRIRAVLDNVREGIITTDATGKIESLNQAATELLGVQAADTLGRNFKEFLDDPAQLDYDKHNISPTIKGKNTGKLVDLQGIAIRAQDQKLNMDLTLTAMELDGEMKFINILKTTQGVKSRKTA